MEFAHALLIEATQKLLDLSVRPNWVPQILARCPPVLWFGNATSTREKVLTLGANPSRSEFLTDSAVRTLRTNRRQGDQSLLVYREPPENRFRLLSPGETLADIVASKPLRDEIIASYNSYFMRNWYAGWFGHNRDDSYKVEGFLRGLGASYFGMDGAPMQAIHIDLFPFTTLDDFGHIERAVTAALFSNGWARRIVSQLVAALAPSILIIFGRKNCGYFIEYIDSSLKIEWTAFGPAKYFVSHSHQLNVPVACLSTNLGNPKGFTSASLRAFGEFMQQAILHPTVAN
jgi:hypothetical protein